MKRRSFLARVVGAATPFAAGCLGSPGGGSGTPSETQQRSTPTASPTPTATATPTPSPTPTERPGPDVVVRLQQGHANPPFASISAGGTVEWVNEDPYPHRLTATEFHDGATEWDFGPVDLSEGDSITHTFEERGQYEYYGIREGQDTLCGAVTVSFALGEGLPCE